MIVDGKAIAKDIRRDIKADLNKLAKPLKLIVLTCSPGPETKQYLALKKKHSEEVGIQMSVNELLPEINDLSIMQTIAMATKNSDGVLVQLPLPPHLNREVILATIPPEKDPDGFSYLSSEKACIPPVTGAIIEIAKRHDVEFIGKNVVVVGLGRLVGAPAAHYLRKIGASVSTVEQGQSLNPLKDADIVVSGIGKQGLIQPEMVKEGVLIFDAGTSEDGGELKGDVDPRVAEKAGLFTPVPGGIGPITVAVLLQNLVTLTLGRRG